MKTIQMDVEGPQGSAIPSTVASTTEAENIVDKLPQKRQTLHTVRYIPFHSSPYEDNSMTTTNIN